MILTKDALKNIRWAGRINSEALRVAIDMCHEGTPLRQIDSSIKGTILYNGGQPAFLNYQPTGASTPYPASSCISVNHVAVHGVPNDYELQLGDIVTIDIGTEFHGTFADAARTIIVGEYKYLSSTEVFDMPKYDMRAKLRKATKEILYAQMSAVKDGASLMDLVLAAEHTAQLYNVTVMPEWGGHGIGAGLHLPPFIPSALDKRQTPLKQQIDRNQYARYKLRAGETICIEPVVSFGPQDIMIDEDGWTVKTKSGEDVAHFEHCLLVTKTGFEILS